VRLILLNSTHIYQKEKFIRLDRLGFNLRD
jgi:hypothetical protein